VGDHLVDGELSIGDFVLAGGEAAALVVIEAVTRLVPSVLGNEASVTEESFADGLLEYPQYTRPAEFRGWGVPEVLRSGDHAKVARWRAAQTLVRTLERRPDLVAARGGLGPRRCSSSSSRVRWRSSPGTATMLSPANPVRVEARIPCIPPKSSTATPCATTFRLPPR